MSFSPLPSAFPLTMTWAELAELPDAHDAFSWDDSMIDDDQPDLASYIAGFSEAFTSSDKLATYLAAVGYELTYDYTNNEAVCTGITVRSETALRTANAIFSQIMFEYDEPNAPIVEHVHCGHPWPATATWALFDLGGDDDVDYCGTQPSCLTDLLLRHVNMGTDA